MNQNKAADVVIVTGPTAVGKSAMAVRLARELDGEIISADSMQVYRHMNIGTAKITEDEMGGIPHHLINILEPEEEFNVMIFQKLAKEAIQGILDRGRLPIIAGGTGFYIQSVLNDISFTEEVNPQIRTELEQFAAEAGAEALHEALRKVDAPSAESIHKNNVKRVIRALEYYRQTGERISDHNSREREKQSSCSSCYFVLNDERDRLYANIDKRVDQMVKLGLVEEVISLRDRGCTKELVSMQGLGYKEILEYLDGTITLEEAVYRIKRDTRHFAKRQLTWFRREREVIWLNKKEFDYEEERILSFMRDQIEKREGNKNGASGNL